MQKIELGLISEKKSKIAFFGHRHSTIENLTTHFPHMTFIRLNQVHGNRVVETITTDPTEVRQAADAHITSTSNLALCISTADCVPILITSASTPWIAAIHAGWRGISTNILKATLTALRERGVPLQSLELFIGPHVQQQSYEVDENVKNLVVGSTSRKNPKHFQDLGSGKYLLSLGEVLRSQCLDLSLLESQVNFVNENTRDNLMYYSVRRDKETLGRQISFVCSVKSEFRFKHT